VRVAIPTFEGDVAPRFCFAREALVVDLEAGLETRRLSLPLPEGGYPDRLRVLQDNGVGLLVCDGFNRAFLAEAERAGVHVVWGISGSIESAVRTLIASKLASCRRHLDCWCRGRTIHSRRIRRRAGHRDNRS
jgi:predicted Fe-Mo cluster-binding NifX family protein